MASEKDFELLDDYIGNRLNGPEKQAFEEKLNSDTDLQTEYKIQQSIVESLRNARAAELKAILNNIPLSSIPAETASLGKWGGAAAVAVVAVGLFFYFKPDHSAKTVLTQDSSSVESVAPAKDTNVTTTQEEASPIVAGEEKGQAEQKKSNTTKKADQKKTESGAAPAVSPELDVYDPSAENTETRSPDSTAPATTEKSTFKSEVPTEINASSKTLTFHYQFKDEKLVLFGPFDKNLYEILEFISGSKRTMFLYYKANYYLIDPVGEKVKPLRPVNDPVLIQKLKEYRSQ